jgi:hypothetical protein
MVLRELLWILIAGLLTGVPAAMLLARYTETQLFGVKARDVTVIASAVLALTMTAIAAGYLPARKARASILWKRYATSDTLMRLRHRHDVYPAIALPARLIVFLADGTLFAVADHTELRRGNTHLHQVVLSRGGTPVAKADVVLGGTTLVAMALDGQFIIWVVFQDVAQFGGIGLQRL